MCIGSKVVQSTKRTEIAVAASQAHAYKLLLSNFGEVYWFEIVYPPVGNLYVEIKDGQISCAIFYFLCHFSIRDGL